ncbi:RimK family alpha-L-glutamate ligase [Patescibacteria group bacterium]
MGKITNFDVLIVYSEKLANSASSVSGAINAPFPKRPNNESYNLAYGYFLKTCRKNNLKAAFTTSADIVGAGLVRSYWLFKNNAWIKVQKTGFSKLIFDKLSPTSKSKKIQRNLLFSSKRTRSFSDPHLFDLCFDKQKTYEALNGFSIPTATIRERTRQGLIEAQKLLKEKMAKHQNKSDFSEEVVVKNRFGAGGLNIYKFGNDQTEKMLALVKRRKSVSFIIQPFVKFDKGFCFQNSSRPTDIRLVYLGQKIIQTYIRIAKKGSFICNEHAGGSLKYISKNKVPLKITAVSNNIAKILNNKSSIYALDFVISNDGNIYFLEANTGPGLDWNPLIKENEIEAKKLIRIIIKEICKRTGLSTNTSEKKVLVPAIDIPLIGVYQYPPTPQMA